jgi:hypothetical protein
MTPQEAAARFAAFTWYVGCRKSPTQTARSEARRFARQNWRGFLPVAHEGWGRFLLRLAKPRPARPPLPIAVV